MGRSKQVLPTGSLVWLREPPTLFSWFGEEYEPENISYGFPLSPDRAPTASGYTIGMVGNASVMAEIGVLCGFGKSIGIEVVYDFKNMERAIFTFDATAFSIGYGGPTLSASAGVSVYSGPLYGFENTESIASYATESRSISANLQIGFVTTSLSLSKASDFNGISAMPNFSVGVDRGITSPASVSITFQTANYTLRDKRDGARRDFLLSNPSNRAGAARAMQADLNNFSRNVLGGLKPLGYEEAERNILRWAYQP